MYLFKNFFNSRVMVCSVCGKEDNFMRIREYAKSDELGWLRCRVLLLMCDKEVIEV